MDAAEAKRLADQEAWRTKQRAKYEAAGGVSMERRLEEQARSVNSNTLGVACHMPCSRNCAG